jgi:hypothetical protein
METFVYFSILAFFIAGGIELQSNKSRAAKLRCTIPIILGIAAFGLAFGRDALFHLTQSSDRTLSLVMTVFSVIIASSGAFITYSRRSSGVLVACGGLGLAFLWMFSRLVY